MERNFALDGFRALAIMMVFTAHAINSAGSPSILAPLQFGGTGVDLFFVLSGWLIGNQLYREQKTFNNINITKFWVRRWMRTLPAYYAVLGVTIAQQYVTKTQFSFPWEHIVFIQNFDPNLNLFYVSWSLSVEEQFYLFIAPFVAMSLKLNKPAQFSVLVILILSPSLFRALDLYSSLKETHVRIDCCAMGVLLAYLKNHKLVIWQCMLQYSRYLFVLSVGVYIFYYVARYNPSWGINDPSKLLLAILFGVWILWTDSTSFGNQKLWQKLTMHISTRSYAMYLLHVDALLIAKKLMGATYAEEHIALFYGCALGFTLVLSEVLYRCVEIPLIKARKKFSISQPRKAA